MCGVKMTNHPCFRHFVLQVNPILHCSILINTFHQTRFHFQPLRYQSPSLIKCSWPQAAYLVQPMAAAANYIHHYNLTIHAPPPPPPPPFNVTTSMDSERATYSNSSCSYTSMGINLPFLRRLSHSVKSVTVHSLL